MGEPLAFAQDDIKFSGHAIESRIYAEDARNNFMPSTGTITRLKASQGFGVREDRGIEEGQEISVFYDPMIAKLIVWGRSRIEAIDRMKRALREYEIVGVETNLPLNLFVMEHPKFVSGEFDTHFIQQNWDSTLREGLDESETLAAAAVAAFLAAKDSMRGPVLQPRVANGFPSRSFRNEVIRARRSWKQQRDQAMRG